MATGENVSGEAGVIPVDLNLTPTLNLTPSNMFNDMFKDMGAATSSAASNAPITFSIGGKQVLSGRSAADSTSNIVKMLLTIAGVAAVIYFFKKGGK